MRYRETPRVIATVVLLLNFVFAYTASAENLAELVSANSTVEFKASGKQIWQKISQPFSFNTGDSIRTGTSGQAALKLVDGGVIRLSPNSLFTFEQSSGNTRSVKIDKGKAFFFSREAKNFPTINTAVVSAAVRGTEFVVEANDDTGIISVLDGNVLAKNKKGEVTLSANEVARVHGNEKPQKMILLNPIDAVQWAVYVPQLESSTESNLLTKTATGRQLQNVIKALSSGNIEGPKKQLKNILPASKNVHEMAIYKAANAFVALISNNKEEAKLLSTEALNQDSKSPFVLLVSSYVNQGFFDLASAKENVESALSVNLDSSFSKLRLAELNLSLGEVEKAKSILVSLPPSSQRASLQGFIALTSNKSREAQADFLQAIELDPMSGLPHLGLGLALINQGQLSEGRSELEIAAALEPTVAIYRSYLGKAFFEEERENLATHEYSRAIALDPRDPTPYLYRAYSHLSQNAPVNALSDIEDSVSRNNNRAVYRSSFYLDRDSAVRSAGLAEVFTSLGFNRASQIEAIKSINQDYSNYSAHRLLADSYNTINSADALQSEQAISKVYAPLSFNLLNNPGGSASVNEYNALFEREETRTTLGFAGSTLDDLLLPTATVAGRTEQLGYLLEASSANAGGSKDNDYSRDQRLRGALQFQASDRMRLFTEGRYQARHVVDHESVLDDVIFENHEFVLGFNYQLTPNSVFIGQVSHRNMRNSLFSFGERPILLDLLAADDVLSTAEVLDLREHSKEDVRDTRISAQYYQNTELVSVVAGAESYFASPNRREASTILDDDFDLFPGLSRKLRTQSLQDINSEDVYLYPTVHIGQHLDLNLGVNYSNLEIEQRQIPPFVESTRNEAQWNPKAGATVYITPDLTFRTAYWEGIRKSALEDTGTLEPTLIGGFNQVYTDFSGARSRSYGTGLDYKLSKKTYLGVEAVRRHVIEADNTIDNTVAIDFDKGSLASSTAIREEFDNHFEQGYLSAYVYQVLTNRFVGTIDYNWFKSETTDPDIYQDITLHKVKTALRYFDPRGWFAFVEGTVREQDRDGSFFVEDGNSNFWLFDAGLGYRFPRRHGSIVLRCNNIFDNDFDYDQSLGFEEFVSNSISGQIAVTFNF